VILANLMTVRDFAPADDVADAVDHAPGTDHVVPWRRRDIIVRPPALGDALGHRRRGRQ
jgi:hypothetical protein